MEEKIEENGICVSSAPECEEWRNSAGQLHRLDGPALITTTVVGFHKRKIFRWYYNGEVHRNDGPAFINHNYISPNENDITYIEEAWFKHNNYHRTDGPAYIHEFADEWWIDGKRHRLDGPAVVRKDGFMEYFIDGDMLSYGAFMKYKRLLELENMFLTTLETLKHSQIDTDDNKCYYSIPKTLVDDLIEKIASP